MPRAAEGRKCLSPEFPGGFNAEVAEVAEDGRAFGNGRRPTEARGTQRTQEVMEGPWAGCRFRVLRSAFCVMRSRMSPFPPFPPEEHNFLFCKDLPRLSLLSRLNTCCETCKHSAFLLVNRHHYCREYLWKQATVYKVGKRLQK